MRDRDRRKRCDANRYWRQVEAKQIRRTRGQCKPGTRKRSGDQGRFLNRHPAPDFAKYECCDDHKYQLRKRKYRILWCHDGLYPINDGMTEVPRKNRCSGCRDCCEDRHQTEFWGLKAKQGVDSRGRSGVGVGGGIDKQYKSLFNFYIISDSMRF